MGHVLHIPNLCCNCSDTVWHIKWYFITDDRDFGSIITWCKDQISKVTQVRQSSGIARETQKND